MEDRGWRIDKIEQRSSIFYPRSSVFAWRDLESDRLETRNPKLFIPCELLA